MSTCTAAKHGNENAYVNHGCRCEAARLDRAHKQKQRRLTAHLRGPVYRDSTGVTRRLQALAGIGWSAEDLAARLGVTRRQVELWRSGRYPTVRPETIAAVDQVYRQLQGTPGPSPKARGLAARARWAPPLAWDDIDDPTAEPLGLAGQERATGIDLGEVSFLDSYGVSREETARRMGVKPESIERAEQRATERDAVTRARVAIHDALTNPSRNPNPIPIKRELEYSR